MIAVGLGRLAETVGAELTGAGPDAEVTSVVVDSRQAQPGSLFVALPGEHVDGHDFVARAAQAGAVAALTTRPVPGVRCLVVPDAQQALGRVGRLAVDLARPQGLRVTGITGSQGKTSTKDLLAQVLETQAPTVAPVASFNNEIGVPLTACRVGPDTRFLVSEMGARGIGHIRYLCELTPPDVGMVLNVGFAHLGMFGSREAIAQAKGELAEAVPGDGVAVLNLGDPLVAAMHTRTRAAVVGFLEPDAEPDAAALRVAARLVSAVDPTADDAGCWSFGLRDSGTGETHPVRLRLLGAHQIGNALAAAAAATALGLAPAAVAEALSAAGPRSRWRMETHRRADGLLVVNDAYNANPGSMSAALRTLAGLGASRRAAGQPTRTVAVLGEMLELGDSAADEHAAVGRLAAELGIDRLLTVGDHADVIREGARAAGLGGEETAVFDTVDALREALLAEVASTDVVLVKASRAIGLETVADALLGDGPEQGSSA
ncbi:UDP-N-acetylmuramoyl-tripeptide--D-alanyl-D-alanine ligase [Friedmanniella endophytica]|uniref:UDP-N-acetylmuramoyl-tripeptide--D-alanyl-D-alanine ligase n=1 Tax=Microlunatus kandeliicorticis TaxID=1759536 RepID=A0A7W3ISA8_9ACTN|nr:UDP-N-acetylmuramoyl-tripeptide--D-alanyl-D-alanine ligase [Microlunatus kandeliicorticis]MBA8794314.1 UDP-N-acetylmuramoyl-tripeptide--D-alanyl-D-alanine ligase [Microlunatus kandeliicorticis]